MKRRLLLPLFLLLAGLGALTSAPPPPAQRPVWLARGLSDEQLIVLSANLAASGRPDPLLLDSPKVRPHLPRFVKEYRADRVIPVGAFAEGQGQLSHLVGTTAEAPLTWGQATPEALWKWLFPKADAVVLCQATPRRLLLQAACLAGTVRAPLVVLHGTEAEDNDLRRRLNTWGARKVYAVGALGATLRGLGGVEVVSLMDEPAVRAHYLEWQREKGPIQTLVVANPADVQRGPAAMSSLAPWMAARHRAGLVLTDDKGSDAAAVIRAALKEPALRQADHLILAADPKAVPMERRANPLKGVEQTIDLEPPGPAEGEPFTLATGRLFHRDPAVVPLMLARQELLTASKGPRTALVVSNTDNVLPLLETISRFTAKEFPNAGYETTALFGAQGSKATIRRLMPSADIFLWEGHHGTLVGAYGVPNMPEPLRPSLVVLQSCLALTEADAQPFLTRGAIGVIGAPSRTYSATGAAFSLAYFDALLYDDVTVGGALRQAKNFLLAYARLKEKRLGEASKLSGANVRSAWAFTLWGDPTVKLPRPAPPAAALPAVHAEAHAAHITLTVPKTAYEKVSTTKYQAVLWPNGRLAGLVNRIDGDNRKQLIPLLFAEVRLKAAGNKRPRLTSKVPSDYWVYLWDARRQTVSLLLRPRSRDRGEIRFQVAWQD
jgi:hypothetical protein